MLIIEIAEEKFQETHVIIRFKDRYHLVYFANQYINHILFVWFHSSYLDLNREHKKCLKINDTKKSKPKS
jgi:hypothetical protein